MKKSIKFFVLTALVLVLLVGCSSGESSETGKITIGASPSPHAEILNLVVDDLEAEGVELEVKEFQDYITPNTALVDGDIDGNFFQHVPYFENFCEENDADLEILCAVHIEPMGVFSNTITSLDELQDGDEILIPNDVVNGARALLLLETQGLITLEDSTNLNSTEKDIVDNPKNLKFTALEAAIIPRSMDDAAAAVINGNYALDNGLNPIEDSIVIEGAESPYVNIIAVQAGDAEKEDLQKLKSAILSDEVKNFILEEYNGAVVPVF